MLLALASELRDQGHEVLGILPAAGERWLWSEFQSRGIPLEELRIRGPADLPAGRRLFEICRSARLDILHSHEFAMAVFGSVAAKAAGCPHLITMHGGLYFAEHIRRRLALRVAAGLSGATVTVSDMSRSILARYLGLGPDDVTTVYNGAVRATGSDARLELGAQAGDLLVVAIGNLYPVKGHQYLLEAVAALDAPAGDVLVAIAGRGDLQTELEALARHLGLGTRVRFLGFRTDVPAILASADVFVMPSLSEGLPMALIEAMLAGTAVVASSVGGIPELVRDGVHGLLVPPGDSAALASALRLVTEDSALRKRLGAAARERAEREFTVEAMTRRYLAIYRGLAR